MSKFPRTEVGGISLSRLVAGSNWWLGYAHQTQARATLVKATQTRKKIADVLEVFAQAGVNCVLAPPEDLLIKAVDEAEDRTGKKIHRILTPNFDVPPDGGNLDEAQRSFDKARAGKATFCWPHTCITDRLYDGLTRTIRHMDVLCKMIRQRGMIPGLSTHVPQVIRAADDTKLDVASYICIYNSAGFLMPLEIDWTQRLIHSAKKPVMTIKPMAAGRVMPYVGLPFVWSTLRDIDLVSAGTTTPDEAREVIEMSLAALEHRAPRVELQMTRSKKLL